MVSHTASVRPQPDQVLLDLETAAAAHLLTEVPGTAGRFAFPHDLVRQALRVPSE